MAAMVMGAGDKVDMGVGDKVDMGVKVDMGATSIRTVQTGDGYLRSCVNRILRFHWYNVIMSLAIYQDGTTFNIMLLHNVPCCSRINSRESRTGCCNSPNHIVISEYRLMRLGFIEPLLMSLCNP